MYKYIKITNLVRTEFGNSNYDYKGLDQEGLIVAGSQIYDTGENGTNSCVMACVEELGFTHPDIRIITEEEYYQFKDLVEQKNPPTAPSVTLEDLQEQNLQFQLALAEMAEAHEQEKTEMQLALAELAELVGGEANHG